MLSLCTNIYTVNTFKLLSASYTVEGALRVGIHVFSFGVAPPYVLHTARPRPPTAEVWGVPLRPPSPAGPL